MAITTKQHGNAVTITFDGKEFEVLQRIADALRLLSWAGGDDTPESVCREFVAWGLRDEFDPPSQLADGIVCGIDLQAKGDAELEAARTEEVRRVLEEAGLFAKEAEVGAEV